MFISIYNFPASDNLVYSVLVIALFPIALYTPAAMEMNVRYAAVLLVRKDKSAKQG